VDQYDDRWEDWTQWVDGRYCCFSYILLSSPLVRLVSEHREGVVEEKIFPASVCDCITYLLPWRFSFRSTTDHSPPLFAVRP